MDRHEALRELPSAYAVALRMREHGADDHTISVALEVPVEAVGRLVAIAESKLQAIIDMTEPDSRCSRTIDPHPTDP